MREIGFEYRLCAHLESRSDAIVARQLGVGVETPGRRIIDVLTIEPGPAFDERAAISAATIPKDVLAAEVPAGSYVPASSAIKGPPQRRQRVLDKGIEVGFFETRQRNGRTQVKAAVRYPAWFGRLRGFENKPNLEEPGSLEAQLAFDCRLGLLDELIVVTESYVTRAHLNRFPDRVGVWRLQPNTTDPVTEIRAPQPLPTRGIEVREVTPGQTDIAVVEEAAIERRRRTVAERAYGKGWRPDFPGCTQCSVQAHEEAALPYCAWKDRLIETGECGPTCPGFEPEARAYDNHQRDRSRATCWVDDPEGVRTRQGGLGEFTDAA